MNAVKYIRVSTKDQNIARQTIKNTPEGFSVLEVVDKCSGTIPFNKRDNAPKVLKMAKEGVIDTLLVDSIDRLGRNTLDILQTIQEFTNLGINVKSQLILRYLKLLQVVVVKWSMTSTFFFFKNVYLGFEFSVWSYRTWLTDHHTSFDIRFFNTS